MKSNPAAASRVVEVAGGKVKAASARTSLGRPSRSRSTAFLGTHLHCAQGALQPVKVGHACNSAAMRKSLCGAESCLSDAKVSD